LTYKIKFKKSVAKDLNKINRSDADKILQKLTSELSVKADDFPELQGEFTGLRNIELGIIVLFTQSLMIPHWFSEFNTEKMYIEIEWGENK